MKRKQKQAVERKTNGNEKICLGAVFGAIALERERHFENQTKVSGLYSEN